MDETQRFKRFFYLLFLLLYLTISTITIFPTWKKNSEMKKQIKKLQLQIVHLRKKELHLQNQLKAIKTKRFSVEYYLRNKLFYGREGELKFRKKRRDNQ